MTFVADKSQQYSEAMSSPDVLYFFNIWLDAVELDQCNLDEIGQIRSIGKFFNEYCKRFLSKRKISKLLEFKLCKDKINAHESAIYDIDSYTTPFCWDISLYIDYCKALVLSRNISEVTSIIKVIYIAWTKDIYRSDKQHRWSALAVNWPDYWLDNETLYDTDKDQPLLIEWRNSVIDITMGCGSSSTNPIGSTELIDEILLYIFKIRNKGFLANKDADLFKRDRNEMAVMHNNRILQWMKMQRRHRTNQYHMTRSMTVTLYSKWISDEKTLKLLDWTEGSGEIRLGNVVSRYEYYFKNHIAKYMEALSKYE